MKTEQHFSHESVDEVINYFQASGSLGVMSLILMAQNETLPLIAQPFSDGLVQAQVREFSYEKPCLLSSDYPTSRWGGYLKDLLFIVAISPAKAGHFQTIQPSQYLIISSLKPQASSSAD